MDQSLSKEETIRYDRQVILSDFGVEAQLRLKSARVLVIGLGGLGSIASLYLASAGIGYLGIVEYDSVDISNIHRQILYKEQDIGKSKANLAKQILTEHNLSITLICYEEYLTNKNIMEVLSKYDIVLDATDNIKARYLISDACALLKKPLVHGTAVAWDGYVTVLNYSGGPCYRCLFPETAKYEAQRTAARAGIMGVVAGIIGQLMAQQAILLAAQKEGILTQRMLTFDGRKTKFTEMKLRGRSAMYYLKVKSRKCPVCGDKATIKDVSEVDYDLLCNVPKRELLPNEIITPSELTKDNAYVVIDTRAKTEYIKVIHIPLFELKNSLNKIEILLNKKISI
jgi:adenylyltransferase/sulfurtransferase